MRGDTIAAFLDDLAARVPAPGGGATAASHAAQAAALLAMVARYSDGAQYDAELMNRVIMQADELRYEALALGEADATAFSAATAAYRLPRDSLDRPGAISAALASAARPPADVIRAAAVTARLNIEVNLKGSATRRCRRSSRRPPRWRTRSWPGPTRSSRRSARRSARDFRARAFRTGACGGDPDGRGGADRL